MNYYRKALAVLLLLTPIAAHAQSGMTTRADATDIGLGVVPLSRIVSSAAGTNATGGGSLGRAHRVYKIFACNTTTTAKFIRFYDITVAPTPGTTPVLFSRPLPAAATAGAYNCQSFDQADVGWTFNNGLAYAITGAAPDNDTTALVAGDVQQVSIEGR